MSKSLITLAAAALLASTGIAEARTINLTTQLKSYGGNRAYVAIYLTDANGTYKRTLVLAGGSAKYYRHLPAWYRATRGRGIDGVTGASVGSGRTLKVSVDLADALIDAGYQIRIDSAVENGRENAGEVKIPLSSANAGKSVKGRGYVKAFKFDM